MKKNLFIIFIIILAAVLFTYFNKNKKENTTTLKKAEEEYPNLEKYSVENLSSREIKSGDLKIKEVLEEKENFTSYKFEFYFNPDPENNLTKKTTGMINIPKNNGSFPLVIMIRGYVDPKNYTTGTGSKNLSYFLAEKGFITIAPDFLGYANSDREASNIFESRFQTYTTVLSLIKSSEKIEKWDRKNIFIWGHSNGGQVSLYVLEVLGTKIPTVLWAPVSKPFPYSVLYYTDESEDKGKFLRKELSKFESRNNVDKFSITSYFDRLNSPILIIQGTSDEAVPEKWSEELFKKLKKLGKEVKYETLSGADHNLRPKWNEGANKTLDFFIANLTR
jgi:dipeptidyl aminopeptidase/acylaminoacyl peptidase